MTEQNVLNGENLFLCPPPPHHRSHPSASVDIKTLALFALTRRNAHCVQIKVFNLKNVLEYFNQLFNNSKGFILRKVFKYLGTLSQGFTLLFHFSCPLFFFFLLSLTYEPTR